MNTQGKLTPTILLLGKNGQVGWELQRALATLGKLVALDRREADLSQPASLHSLVDHYRPSVIVNAAAYTSVDKAESEPALAHTINAQSPLQLAVMAQKHKAWLVHFSTDYVFDGSGSSPWQETDTPAPLNAYGMTKLEGEKAIESHCEQHIILRTSWVYAARGMNFAKTMRKLASEREELSVVNDQVGAPTGADLIADVSAHIIRQVLSEKDEQSRGIYHLTAHNYVSWFDYAKFVIEHSSKSIVKQLHSVPSSAFPSAARRPLNSRLSTNKLEQRFGLTMPEWHHGVLRMLEETKMHPLF